MTAVLCISVALIVYVYVGYPVLLWLFGLIRPRPVRKEEILPPVTVITAARNEVESIGATIENKLAFDYPRDRLEIIVVSDCSDDGTDEVVQQFPEDNVILLRQEPQQGKTAALNLAVQQAKGDILVFSDANSMYAQDAL